MIKDTDGNELTYWPISGLLESETSEVLEFIVEAGGTGALFASLNSHVKVWVKRTTSGPYQDISTTPLPLTGLIGDIHFDCYIEALSPIVGLERVPISVVAGTSFAAGWAS